ncbi:MAG: hypothetical protein A2552_09030 [Sulfuricurvum sp. RIFOXYD2_FULL_44_160]|nr:MAG: hypothetical protein A2517_04625 [Sulfuricurvum sp. RIFOXYD12_FULL_44_77]OHD96115.1 MAG: hypothetical protein A2552_09030 [Sulfuricurvum sp. RIFOXYD2_FULL_44_160]
MIIDYLKTFKYAKRHDITALLLDKLPDILDEKQKHNKIRNILYSMSKKDQSIAISGSSQKGVWILNSKIV